MSKSKRNLEEASPETPRKIQQIAIALVDSKHRIVSASKAMADCLGYTVAELCGKTFEEITYPPDVDIDADLAERIFHGEIESYEMIKRYVHKSGSLVRALLTVSVPRNPDGEILYVIGQMQPIGNTPAKSMPLFQHDGEPNNEIERIKRAMFD